MRPATELNRREALAAEVEGRSRVVIERVEPEVDCGRFAVKRAVGEVVVVEADVFADGHDLVACVLRHRRLGQPWREVRMRPLGNDRWQGRFVAAEVGRHEYTVWGWIDRFATWRRDLEKRVGAGQDVRVDLLIGAGLVEEASAGASGEEREELAEHAAAMRRGGPEGVDAALDDRLAGLMAEHDPRRFRSEYARVLELVVDPELAKFSAWYELFPRSASPEPGRHGTFSDVRARLPRIAAMGFDVLYLPPVHPIGRTHRKGKNNAERALPEDVGSPWAIGASEGGHKAVHPELGTLEEFRELVAEAGARGIRIALDLAYQVSPDHPYVAEHPEWFRRRPDGTVQYAENPPKKYQDIYPFDFESEAWRPLWEELKSVVEFWVGQGVTIFRVDNPHTKSFAFWEWMIGEVKREHPEVIFLSEAFTRPKVMYRLAKLGFSQSYTYFAWKNTKWELEQYFTEVVSAPVREFFRPNAWPNTPDILNEYLVHGGRPAFAARLVLAATLCANYGVYGPAFELAERTPREPGSEEYMDSEKYQLRAWDVERGDSLAPLIARVNRIRRRHPALQQDRTLRFHPVDNPQLICYSKTSEDGEDLIVCVVNLDPHGAQWGSVELPLEELGIGADRPYQVHDLLTDARYVWSGARNYVGLDPGVVPAHILKVRRRSRTERDFEYYV